MSAKHLRRDPHHTANKRVWWYEEAGGITIVHEPQMDTTQTVIPWFEIRAALKRKDAKV